MRYSIYINAGEIVHIFDQHWKETEDSLGSFKDSLTTYLLNKPTNFFSFNAVSPVIFLLNSATQRIICNINSPTVHNKVMLYSKKAFLKLGGHQSGKRYPKINIILSTE